MYGGSSVHVPEELQEGFPEEVVFELDSIRQVGVFQPSRVESSFQAEGMACSHAVKGHCLVGEGEPVWLEHGLCHREKWKLKSEL